MLTVEVSVVRLCSYSVRAWHGRLRQMGRAGAGVYILVYRVSRNREKTRVMGESKGLLP